jgi:hypothetical protein
MDDLLLNQYIEQVIMLLHPNMNKQAIFDLVTGKLNQGPVILTLDAGPWNNSALRGRFVEGEAFV